MEHRPKRLRGRIASSQIMRRKGGGTWQRRSIQYWSRGSRPVSLWTPEADGLLIELCTRWGAATAKRVMGRKIQESRVVRTAPRPDSVRKAVEYRMAKLGISMGQKRRKTDMRKAKSWSQSETTALLGALGADATIESIAARTGHM